MTAFFLWFVGPIGKYFTGALVILAVVGGIYFKGRHDGEAKIEAAVAAANKRAEAKAEHLSTDLLIEQVKAMSATAKKVSTSVEQIRSAADDAARNRAGSVGVCAIIRGEACPAK